MTIQTNNIISDQLFGWSCQTLSDLVAIPSISNKENSDYDPQQLEKAADFVKRQLDKLGFDAEKIRVNEEIPPYVVAQKVFDETLPTIVFYAHYDVQPVDRRHWKSDPFVMEERDGRLYGRGASDDKAGVVGIITAMKYFMDNNKPLPVNVKFLFEGEEEYGSDGMPLFLEKYHSKVDGDALVVLDAGNRDVETGTLTSMTRGLTNLTLQVNSGEKSVESNPAKPREWMNFSLKVSALEKPIHSGIGCLAPDPALAISALVSSLADQNINVSSLNSGCPNGGNSVQDSAEAQFSVALIEGEDSDQVAAKIRQHLDSQPVLYNIPFSLEVLDITPESKNQPQGSDVAIALASLINSVANPNSIPGFLNGAAEVDDEERKILRYGSISHAQHAKELGMLPGTQLRGDSSKSVYERIQETGNLSVINMTKNEGNDSASCQISVRVLPGQDPNQVADHVINHLKNQPVTENVSFSVTKDEACWGWKGVLSGDYSTKYLKALAKHFPQACGMPCGGALPLLLEFQRKFPKMEMILPAVIDPASSMHSHNESQDISVYRKAIDSVISFLKLVGK